MAINISSTSLFIKKQYHEVYRKSDYYDISFADWLSKKFKCKVTNSEVTRYQYQFTFEQPERETWFLLKYQDEFNSSDLDAAIIYCPYIPKMQ